jgi:hypothetical protein
MIQRTVFDHRIALAKWAAMIADGAQPLDLSDAVFVLLGILEKAALPKKEETALCEMLDMIDAGEEFGKPELALRALQEFVEATARIVAADQLAQAA